MPKMQEMGHFFFCPKSTLKALGLSEIKPGDRY